MSRSETPLPLTAIALAITLALAGPALAVPRAAVSTLERIEAAYRAGEIDDEQYVLYRLYRVLDRSRLPASLQAPASDERPVRCATPIVREARFAEPWLSEAGREAVAELLAAPLPNRETAYTSDNFQVIVGDDGGVAMDTVDFWLETFEHVWDAEVDDLGFSPPPCTDQYYFDVYMGNTGNGSYPLEDDVYGYVDHYESDCPFMVVHAEFAWAGDPEGAAQVTAAHEFLHGIQSGYNWFVGNYWMEASAVWAEELVYDDADDYVQYLNNDGWMSYPELAMEFEDGWHEYGNVVWPLFIDQTMGPEAVLGMWEACRDTDDAIEAFDTYFAGEGTSMGEVFMEFAAALGADGLEEQPQWDPLWVTEIDGYPAELADVEYPPESYGSNFVRLRPSGGVDTLALQFEGATENNGQSIQWGAAVVAWYGDGSGTYEILAVPGDGAVDVEVDDFGGDVVEVVMVLSVLGPSGRQPGMGGVPYTLSASLGGLPSGDDDDDDGGRACQCDHAEDRWAPELAALALLSLVAVLRRRR